MTELADDLPLHAVADDDRAYERYWFGFGALDGSAMVGLVVNVHPRLGLVDAAFSVSDGARATSVFATASGTPGPELAAGPVRLSLDDPMRHLRITVDGDGFDAVIDVTAATPPIGEDRVVRERDGHVVQDRTRYVQLGLVSGHVRSPLGSWTLDESTWRAGRDHSWGIWDAPAPGAPPRSPTHGPSFFWLIGAFDGDGDGVLGVQAVTHAEPDGTRYGEYAAVVGADGEQHPLPVASIDVTSAAGTRHMAEATLSLGAAGGASRPFTLTATSLHATLPRAVGYAHPTWIPGRSPIGTRTESWTLAELDLLAPENHRALQFARLVRGDGAVGWAFVDQSG